MRALSPLATLEDAASRGDAVRFWREPRYDGLECLSATFRTHRYVPHTHETYAIAAVVEGCETFVHRGARHYATARTIAVICPDELHDGEPAGAHFVYRTVYPSVDLMRSIAEDVLGKPVSGTPSFSQSIVADEPLFRRFAQAHALLADQQIPLLARDEALHGFFAALIGRWASLADSPPVGAEHKSVERVRGYIDAHFDRDLTLEEIAAVAGLNRTHLLRVFRRETGTTPHAYLLDRRFRAAGRMLVAGDMPAEVAAACGFCDQSHLNRVFKARMGVTPGAFRVAA